MLTFQNTGIQVPPEAGKVIGMCSYRDRVLLATEYGQVWEIVDDGFQNYSLRQIMIDRVEELERLQVQSGESHE